MSQGHGVGEGATLLHWPSVLDRGQGAECDRTELRKQPRMQTAPQPEGELSEGRCPGVGCSGGHGDLLCVALGWRLEHVNVAEPAVMEGRGLQAGQAAVGATAAPTGRAPEEPRAVGEGGHWRSLHSSGATSTCRG